MAHHKHYVYRRCKEEGGLFTVIISIRVIIIVLLTFYSMDGYEKGESEKPDFMLGIADRKRELYFFYVELKRPECISRYQKEDDFCKLMKQMKVSVDKQVKLKLGWPVSFGLLCDDKYN